MHQMKLTNKQIQEILVDLRKQLKQFSSTNGKMQINFELPTPKHKSAQLVFSQTAWLKMNALIDECDKEIAWHGLVERPDKDTFLISDIIVFPQTVTGCTVNSDETEYSMWLADKPDNVFNKIRFHGHSHVNMGTSPSGVDTDYQENILRNLKDFYIFAIFNKKGDHWCAIYDLESNLAYGNNDIEVVTPETDTKSWAKEMIKEFVKDPATVKPKAAKKKKIDDDDDPYTYYDNDFFRRFYGQG